MANSQGENHALSSTSSIELVKSIVDNQKKETELKRQIEENRKQSLKYNFDLAKQSLQVQVEDRREQRAHQKILGKWLMWFGGFIASLIVIFMCFALYMGKENFVLEIFRIIFYGGAGYCIGISSQKFKRKNNSDTEENSE